MNTVFLIDKISLPISNIMVSTSHIMIPIITLFGTLNFYLLFKLNIHKKTDSTIITLDLDSSNITYNSIYITFDGTN